MANFIEINGLVRVDVSSSVPDDVAQNFLRTLSVELGTDYDPESIMDRLAVLSFRAGISTIVNNISADSDAYHAIEDGLGS